MWLATAWLGLTGLGCTGEKLAEGASAPSLSEAAPEPGSRPRRSGELVIALPAEPRTLNPVFATDNPSLTVLGLLHADLLHLDPHSQESEPVLVESWSLSPDGKRFHLELRRDLRFADGEPLSAEDVLFTFEVLLDEDIASPYRGFLLVGDEPVTLRKVDDFTVEVDLAEPYASRELLFHGLPILPRHRLEPLYRQGQLPAAWTLATAPEEIAGLGPFRLASYVPGQRLVLERNPHYFKVDDADTRLPYLDRLTILFVADRNAQALRFQAGETHLIDRLSAETFNLLETSRDAASPYVLRDLGPGLAYHFLFFNLNPRPAQEQGSELAIRQEWFRQQAFRQAVSTAIDRQALARLAFHGRATPVAGPVPPGNRWWVNEDLEIPQASADEARRQLEAAGFSYRQEASDEASLQDADGRPVRFSLLVNAGNEEQKSLATLIQADLAAVGIAVQVVPLEFRALTQRVLASRDYEACLLALTSEADPNGTLNVWLSSGSHHFWHLGQETPATPWEAEVDRLLEQQLTATRREERHRLFARVQEILADQLPFIFLVSPNVLVGAHRDLGNFDPAVLDPPTLWNVEELYWQEPDARR